MRLGGRTTTVALESSMDHAFRIAREHEVKSIAIPAVGTGIAGYPIDDCARVMARCLRRAQHEGWEPEEVRFVLFTDGAKASFETHFWAVFEADSGSAR